jgi:hypothetical protein
VIELAHLSSWSKAEGASLALEPTALRASVERLGGKVLRQFTLEERGLSTGPGSRDQRFTVEFDGRRFALAPLSSGGYSVVDLGLAP